MRLMGQVDDGRLADDDGEYGGASERVCDDSLHAVHPTPVNEERIHRGGTPKGGVGGTPLSVRLHGPL